LRYETRLGVRVTAGPSGANEMAKLELLSAKHWNRVSGGENEQGTGEINLRNVLNDEREEGVCITQS